MRIGIIGAGAMGSLFGGMLTEKNDVVLVDPFEDHVRTINENGLTVETPGGTISNHRISAVTDPREMEGKADLALIFTKAGGTEAAARTAGHIMGKDGVALTLQNGLGNYEVIAKILGEAGTLGGVTSHGGTLLGPGRVFHAGTGPTHIALPGEEPEKAQRVARCFRDSGIEVETSADLDGLIWAKLIVNVGINALGAILRVPNGVLGSTPECAGIMSRAVEEAVLTAEKLGIALPWEDPLAHVQKVCKATFENRASMLQDTLRGAETEVAVINGAVVKKGREVGVDTPCNAFLTELVGALEATADFRC